MKQAVDDTGESMVAHQTWLILAIIERQTSK
jgi:hypothetical protein